MDDQEPKVHPFDRLVSNNLVQFAQRSSRRGFLAKLGKIGLGVLGVTTASLLPVDRTVREAKASNCSNWYLCGLYGKTCDCCAGDDFHCPYGSAQFGYWSSCCSSKTIYYWDCCNASATCNCTTCLNNPSPQPAWCNGGRYNCTGIVIGAAC